MEMHQVRYFLAVAQELNFSRAAEKCNVTQPSLSRAIQQLEGELGGPLFHRERHLTHLTDLGQMVRPHLETVYNAAVKAKKLSQDLSQLKRVPLKLGIMSTISPDEIVDLIAALKTRYDGLELSLCDANAKDLRERLVAGDLEAVIYALPGEEIDERTHAIPLFSEQMVIAVHQGHRLARERAFPVKDQWRVLHTSGELRICGLCRPHSSGKRRDLHADVLERTRRLDPRHGCSRSRVCLHAGKCRQAPRRRRTTRRRTRVLATSKSSHGPGPTSLAGYRCLGTRGHAKEMVRQQSHRGSSG